MKLDTTYHEMRHSSKNLTGSQEAVVADALSKDHHKRLMDSLQETEQLALLKRFTLDFHADSDLPSLSEEETAILFTSAAFCLKRQGYMGSTATISTVT